MGRTTVNCSQCGHEFKPGKGFEMGLGGSGGVAGGVLGSSAGLAIFGTAVVATAPLAITGAALGVAVGSQLTSCPECGRVQRK
jgi:hypothetical protein